MPRWGGTATRYIKPRADLPIRRRRDGGYRIQGPGEVFTCGTSDFFLEEADAWRAEAWSFIRQRRDLRFLIITKRIERFRVQLPEDWRAGYENVRIGCTVENQDRADALPVFLEMPIRRRVIICEPLLEPINLLPYLDGQVEEVVAGGESGIRRAPAAMNGFWGCIANAWSAAFPSGSNRRERIL